MKNIFLHKVWSADKKLFGIFIGFIAFQLFFTYKGVETFPFLHWGMYSDIHTAKESYTVYTLKADTQTVDFSRLFDPQKEVVLNTLSTYDEVKQRHFYDSLNVVIDKRCKGKISDAQLLHIKAALTNDSMACMRYEQWLLGYLGDMRLVPNANITVLKNQVTYNADASLTILKTDTLFYRNEN